MKSSTVRTNAYGSACAAILIAVALANPAAAAKPPRKAVKPTHKPAAEAVQAAPVASATPTNGILSRHTIETAGAYRSYMDRVARISSAFKNGAQVEESLMVAAQSEPQQLSQGVIAYAAVLALQDPSYVAGVRAVARDEDGRRELVRRIIENPNVATTLPGSSSAAGAISAGLGADGSKVAGAGALVKQAAYDVQHSAWSKASVPGLPARLARAKELSIMTMRAEAADLAAVNAVVAAAANPSTPISAEAMSAPTTQTVSRALSIAALAALGAGGEENDAVVQSLLNDPNAGFCMNMAKLNLNQCLSVAKPYYEDVFCLGQHILIDTGQCVSKGAGQSPVPLAASLSSESGPRPAQAQASYAASR